MELVFTMIPDRPRLRPFLTAAPEDEDHSSFAVFDRMQLSRAVVTLSPHELAAADLFDGSRTVAEIAAEVMLDVESLVARLDAAGFLDGPRFRELAAGPVRAPSCIGAYEEEPDALCQQLHDLFERGAGHPGPNRPDGRFRAILAPHIDYKRGGLTYTHPFRQLAERTDASLFVIVGTSHYSGHRFTLTRKHFQTPLGIAPTDQGVIDTLVREYGDGLFDDEIAAHLPEHSIELEVVFLQYLIRRPFRIVPLLVGSFHDAVREGVPPSEKEEIARMVRALRVATTGEPVCWVISGDLAHIGPKFGQKRPVTQAQLAHSRTRDLQLMDALKDADATAFHGIVVEEQDARNICGHPPTWLTLHASGVTRGELVDYAQFVHPRGKESVSFAGVVFEK